MFVGRKASGALVALLFALVLSGDTVARGQSVEVRLDVSAPFIKNPLKGNRQPLDRLGNLVCEAGQEVGGNLPDGEPVSQALCAIPALDFQFLTRRRTTGADDVRRHTAFLNVPTPLNVDNDLAPDLVASVEVLSLSQFGVSVVRAPTEFSDLPVRVEAILDDPTGGALGREHINAGYDARDGIAPDRWSVAASVLNADGATELDATQQTIGRPTSLTLLGGLFDGDAERRRDPLGGSVQYAEAPATALLGLALGPAIEVRAGASAPTAVRAAAEIVEGPSARTADVELSNLPALLTVKVEQAAADRRMVTYDAVEPVDSLDATYTDRLGGAVTSKIVAEATGIPTGMVLNQTGPRAASFTATGGPLGSVEAGFANGEPRLLEVDHPYARVFDDGVLASYAGRIDGLQSASVDATTKIVGDLLLGPDARKPFRVLVETPGDRRVDGRVSNLPRHLGLSYDPDGGIVEYDAFGETIDEITLDASQDAPFFERVRRIGGRIAGLPPQATVNLKPDGSGMRLASTTPIGQVEALLTSGPDAGLPAGELGAQVEDLASRFTAFARIEGLRLVDVTTGPGDAVAGHVQLASRPLRLRHVTEATTIDASLSPIPSDLTVTFDPDAGTVDYEADAGIASIDATMDSTAPLFGRVKRIATRVERLPSDVTIGFRPPAGSGVKFSTTPPVGMIQAALTDGIAVPPVLPAGDSGVVLRDVPSEFSLFGRLFEVASAEVTTIGADFLATLNTGRLPSGDLQDVGLDATFHTPGDAVAAPAHITANVRDLPATLRLEQEAGKTTYDASSGVPRVTLDARNLPGGSPGGSLDGGLHNAVGTLVDVPTHFEISAGSDAGVVANGAFGRADLELWDHGPQKPALPEDGRNRVQLDTRDGRLHVLARAFELEEVLLGTATTTRIRTAFGTAPAPLEVDVLGGTAAEPVDVDLSASDLSRSSTFTLAQSNGMDLGWDASSPGTDVVLQVSAKDVGAVLDIPNLPSFVDVCFGSGLSACGPKAPSFFQAGSELWTFPNSLTAVTDANDTIRMSGRVCLPPTDRDGKPRNPPGTVFGTCADGTAPNVVGIDGLRLRDQRLELGAGDTTTTDADGDPLEDKLLKLWLEGDSEGIRVDGLRIRNETADSTTVIRAGHTGGLPLRNSGDHFFLLADLNGGFLGAPVTLLRDNQIECDDLAVIVNLPLIGATDVLPFPGERVLGDVCIDH